MERKNCGFESSNSTIYICLSAILCHITMDSATDSFTTTFLHSSGHPRTGLHKGKNMKMFLLFLLPQGSDAEVANDSGDHVEIGLRVQRVFEELRAEKEMLGKAVASRNTIRWKGKANVNILQPSSVPVLRYGKDNDQLRNLLEFTRRRSWTDTIDELRNSTGATWWLIWCAQLSGWWLEWLMNRRPKSAVIGSLKEG